MAIVNRDLDASEQRHVLVGQAQPYIVAATYGIGPIPFPSKLVAAQAAGRGLSGAPQMILQVHRFIAGTGFTAIVLGSTVVVPAFGTSGGVTLSVSAAGVTYPLLAGDVLVFNNPVADTACASVNVSCVIQATQDIRSAFGYTS